MARRPTTRRPAPRKCGCKTPPKGPKTVKVSGYNRRPPRKC